jgi:predicted DNA-binding transcriptional regulator YafY
MWDGLSFTGGQEVVTMRKKTIAKKVSGGGTRLPVKELLPNLVRLYETLQNSDGMTLNELVETLGLARSTVHRYLKDFLPAMLGEGAVVKDGPRYRLDSGFLRVLRLEDSDKQALAIASRILGVIGMPFQREFDNIFFRLCGHDRLRAGVAHQDTAERMAALLAFVEPHVCRPLEDANLVSQLFRASHRRPRTPIRFDYASATTPEQGERLVWPVGLIFNNAWFLLGYDPAKEPHYRVYAVDRIARVRDSFAPGADPVGEYSVSDHLRPAWRLIVGDGQPRPVDLRMPLRLARETKHPSQRILSEDGSQAIVRFEVADPLEMTRWVMAHADEVDVISPEALREAVQDRLQRSLKRWEGMAPALEAP